MSEKQIKCKYALGEAIAKLAVVQINFVEFLMPLGLYT